MIQRLFSIASRRLYRPSKPVRDEAYKRFIRKLPCVGCGKSWGIEAAHFGPHGLGQKASDLQTLPLCRGCHQTGAKSYHKLGPKDFAIVHGIDVETLIAMLNNFYESKLKGWAA
jgi:hypothetical protein